MGTLWIEAVLTCTHNICFEQKYENSQKNATENCHFYSREKWLYIAWACFGNVLTFCLVTEPNLSYRNMRGVTIKPIFGASDQV